MTMMLTKDFRKTLIAKAHQLKPVVLIGAQGLTEAVHAEIEVQLQKHELIKIKVNITEKEVYKPILQEIPTHHHAMLVNTIGRTVVIYRESED